MPNGTYGGVRGKGAQAKCSRSPTYSIATRLLRFLGRGTGEGEGRGVTGSQSLSAVTGGEESVWVRNSVLGHRLFKLKNFDAIIKPFSRIISKFAV